MLSRPHCILLTGFGPFPGVAANASGLLVARLAVAARAEFGGHRIVSDILPTEWQAAPVRLIDLLRETQPTLALHFGVSHRARGFEIETQARNLREPSADACGSYPNSSCIVLNGSESLAATLPVQSIATNLAARRLPVTLSHDAGSYLCNATLYHSLLWAQRSRQPVLTGFIHVPASLAGHGEDGTKPAAGCALDWKRAVAGGLDIIATCIAASVPAGQSMRF